MKLRVILLCAALVCTLTVIVWLHLPSANAPSAARPTPTGYRLGISAPPAPSPAPRSGLNSELGAARPPTDDPTETAHADTGLLFDASGRLIENVRLRDAIERLLSRNPGDLEQSKQDLAASLPPAAAQQMLEMVERFVNYRAALRQTLPDSPQAMSEQDAMTLFETVHALRVTYFGAELTESFFGAEEALGTGAAIVGEQQ